MHKTAKIVISVFVMFFALTACQQRYIIPIPGGVDTPSYEEGLSLEDSIRLIDKDVILKDALGGTPGIRVEYLSDEAMASYVAGSVSRNQSMTAILASREGEPESVTIRVVFTGGYNNGACYINSGWMEFHLEIVDGKATYTAIGQDLGISRESTGSDIVISAEGIKAEISEINFQKDSSGNITTVVIPQSATVSTSRVDGSFSSGSETITVVESEGLASGGSGTENDPFIIKTADELISVSELGESREDKTYVEISNDLSFPANRQVEPIENMVISGADNGITITITGSEDDSESSIWLFNSLTNSSVANIEYRIGNISKAFVGNTYGDVELTNIVIEGDITVVGNNTSVFIAYANPAANADGNVTFTGCVNRTRMNDIGYNYGAPFVAFSLRDGSYGVNFVFDNCRNDADIFYANWASILIGNAYTGATPVSVTIKNAFTNTGTISSFGKIKICSHNDTVENEVIGKNLVTGFNENVNPRLTSGIDIILNNDRLQFTVKDSSIENVKLLGMLYVGYLNSSGKEEYHAANYNMVIANASKDNNFVFDIPVFNVIGSTLYKGDATGDSIVEYKDGQYWYVAPFSSGYESRAGEEEDNGISRFRSFVAVGTDSSGNSQIARVSVKMPEGVITE